VRYLIVSTMLVPDVAEYPDTGGVLVMKEPGRAAGFAAGAAREVQDLVAEALAAERR
jgi:hypothetical protein